MFRLQIQRKNKQIVREERGSKQQRPESRQEETPRDGGEGEREVTSACVVGRPRRAPAFEWGVREEMVPAAVYKRPVAESRGPMR